MHLCLLLHFYQPSTQFGDVIKKVTEECYIPLIKSLKSDKRIRITANFSLSLLEQLDRYGFGWLIHDIKDLVDTGRIELVGSAAYHALLTKIPHDFVDRQVILNESSLAHYFGVNKDFEGEDCFMIKGLKGFFPPEMAVSCKVLDILGDLGYEWVSVDEFCLPEENRGSLAEGFIYRLGSQVPKLIVRDRGLTDLLSFKRDLDKSVIVTEILRGPANKMVALDAETFGHHYKDGINLLESIISDLFEKNVDISTISEAIQGIEPANVENINESTWSSTRETAYPLWENEKNKINTALWLLQKEIHTEFAGKYPAETENLSDSHSGGVPIWEYKYNNSIPVPDLWTKVKLGMLKLEQSDQFWWSTDIEVMGKKNFSRYMIDSVLDYYTDVAKLLGSDKPMFDRIEEIRDSL